MRERERERELFHSHYDGMNSVSFVRRVVESTLLRLMCISSSCHVKRKWSRIKSIALGCVGMVDYNTRMRKGSSRFLWMINGLHVLIGCHFEPFM